MSVSKRCLSYGISVLRGFTKKVSNKRFAQKVLKITQVSSDQKIVLLKIKKRGPDKLRWGRKNFDRSINVPPSIATLYPLVTPRKVTNFEVKMSRTFIRIPSPIYYKICTFYTGSYVDIITTYKSFQIRLLIQYCLK